MSEREKEIAIAEKREWHTEKKGRVKKRTDVGAVAGEVELARHILAVRPIVFVGCHEWADASDAWRWAWRWRERRWARVVRFGWIRANRHAVWENKRSKKSAPFRAR